MALILTLALATTALAQGPVLQSTDPTVNTVDAPQDTDISATFDTALSTGTVDDATFVAHGTQSGILTGTYTFANGDTTATLNPYRTLFPGETVFTTHPDLIILADTLPGPTPAELIARLRAKVPAVQIILLCNDTADQTSLPAEATLCISKSVYPITLLAAFRSLRKGADAIGR